MLGFLVLGALLAQQAGPQAPQWRGDPEGPRALESHLEAALAATEAFGPWPQGGWRLHVHESAVAFEAATGAPPQRSAAWVGDTLHVRPWEQLRRRDVGAVLRHELVHRQLAGTALRRWEEEARCLWAERHPRPPAEWPPAPEEELQDRLDRALGRGTTAAQAWAYGWLRAWLEGRSLPTAPVDRTPQAEPWRDDVPAAVGAPVLKVVWPPERLPSRLVVNGQDLSRRTGIHHFAGVVRFGPGSPVRRLEGPVDVRWTGRGWELSWHTDASTWVAAAVEGELGRGAPPEAQRALAAVLVRWLAGPRRHPDGSLCPLTHCAVVRGQPGSDACRAVSEAPVLALDPRAACFTGSAGGVSLSPREVWGEGAENRGVIPEVPEDRWGRWERRLTAAQVARLKQDVGPGLRPGQKGLMLGASGPYAVERLRIAAGRAFGWTTWPSNACTAELQADGTLHLTGRGWGHNAGLCMARALQWAREGATAEAILQEAFGPDALLP